MKHNIQDFEVNDINQPDLMPHTCFQYSSLSICLVFYRRMLPYSTKILHTLFLFLMYFSNWTQSSNITTHFKTENRSYLCKDNVSLSNILQLKVPIFGTIKMFMYYNNSQHLIATALSKELQQYLKSYQLSQTHKQMLLFL